jgi:excisionase family DNA binding protein
MRHSMTPTGSDPGTPLAYDVERAAQLLGLGRTTTWELVRSGVIPTISIGRRRLVTRAALEDYISGLVQAARTA